MDLTLVRMDVGLYADVMTFMTLERFRILDRPSLLVLVISERFPVVAYGAMEHHQLFGGGRGKWDKENRS
ncbi:MAG: hypothetical protein ABSC21_14405 [Terriglobia bacterium]